jgi:hypothetical protein
LYVRAAGDFKGLVAEKTGTDDFSTKELPFPVSQGVLLGDSLLVDDGTVDATQYYVRQEASWVKQPSLGQISRAHSRAARIDANGCLHYAGANLADEVVQEGRYVRSCPGAARVEGTWPAHLGASVQTLADSPNSDSLGLVFPDREASKESVLRFVDIGQKPPSQWQPETAAVFKPASSIFETPRLAFVGSTEGHHVFFEKLQASGINESEGVVEAWRSASGVWQEQSIAVNEGLPFPAGAPSYQGERYEFSRTTYHVLAAVRLPGIRGVRLLMAKKTQQGNLVAEQGNSVGPPRYDWTGDFRQDGALHVVWREEKDGNVSYGQQEILSSGFDATSADAAVDAAGNIHLLAYVTLPTTKLEEITGDTRVMYWRIGME